MSLNKVSKSTLTKAIEYAVVAFIGATVAVWIKQPNPFSKAAVLVALSAGAGAVLGVVKDLAGV